MTGEDLGELQLETSYTEYGERRDDIVRIDFVGDG